MFLGARDGGAQTRDTRSGAERETTYAGEGGLGQVEVIIMISIHICIGVIFVIRVVYVRHEKS